VSVGIFQFGEFKLDCDGFELTRAGRSVKVERMPMELLILLVARNGQLSHSSKRRIANILRSCSTSRTIPHSISSTAMSATGR
jgi:DNA-binding response OmpR family regulator